MLHITGTRPMDEYMQAVENSLVIYMDEERLEQAAKTSAHRVNDLAFLCLMEMRKGACDGSYSRLEKGNIISYLEENGVEFTKRFLTKGGQPSLDQKKVIDPLIEKGVCVEFLTLYKEHQSMKSYSSALDTYRRRSVPTHVNRQGRFIKEFQTHAEQRENLRVYYNDINIVGFPKLYSNVITVPDTDYFLAWCDYPQADWRFAYNLFIKDNENAKVMAACEDAYEGLARLIEGDSFDPEKFKETRKAYKVDCLSTFYNSRSNKPIAKAMRDFFHSCPRYVRYYEDLQTLFCFKTTKTMTSYFGYEQYMDEAYTEYDFLSKALNTPIQTFTSHVLNETVLGILERFREQGYSEDAIQLYYSRHDEAIFLCKREILKDAWIFQDCSQVHIDGFTPIKLDFHFGSYYTEEDAELSELIRSQMDENDPRLHTYEPGELKEYNPLPPIVRLYGEPVANSAGGVDCHFYHYRTGETFSFHMDIDDEHEAFSTCIREKVIKYVGDPKYLLVQNNYFLYSDARLGDNHTLLEVVKRYDEGAAKRCHG